jgi:hypothetical protein
VGRGAASGLVWHWLDARVCVPSCACAQLRMQSAFDKDGGEWWKKAIRDGQPTFEQVSALTQHHHHPHHHLAASSHTARSPPLILVILTLLLT